MSTPRGYCGTCGVYTGEPRCFVCENPTVLALASDPSSAFNWRHKPYLRDGRMLPEFDGHYPF